MFFYRYKVEESNLNLFAGQLYQWYLSGYTDEVARVSHALRIHRTYCLHLKEWIYFIVDITVDPQSCQARSRRPHQAVLAFCELVRQPRWIALETVMLYVSPLARGQGLATALYDGIMKDGVIVISGYSHNQKSRRLWMKIVQNPRYVTWAHDIKNLSRFAEITIEEDTFQCSLKIYDDIKKIRRRRRHDVRIIAYNPRYAL